MRLRVLAVAALLLGGLLIIEGSAARSATVSIPVLYRDFDHETKVNAPTAHPDFESMSGDDTGIVQETLGSDGKPVYNTTDTNDTVTSQASFNQWFHDDATVNKTVTGSIALDDTAGQVTYDDPDFFPVDGKGWNDPTVGDGTGQVDGGHNFSFTMEMHMTFTYDQGQGQSFTFTGDDDVFVFFNKHLEIDLGGIHPSETDTVDLDAVAAGDGMTDGNTYPLDIFFAERHTSGSSFAIDADFSLAAAPTSSTTSTTSSTAVTTSTTARPATTTTTMRPATTTTTARVGNSTIRRTGTESGVMTTTGAGLLLVGVLLGFVGRRRPSDGRHFS